MLSGGDWAVVFADSDAEYPDFDLGTEPPSLAIRRVAGPTVMAVVFPDCADPREIVSTGRTMLDCLVGVLSAFGAGPTFFVSTWEGLLRGLPDGRLMHDVAVARPEVSGVTRGKLQELAGPMHGRALQSLASRVQLSLRGLPAECERGTRRTHS